MASRIDAPRNSAAEIRQRMCQVCGESFLSDDVVREWCKKCKDGRTEVHDEEEQRRKSATIEDLFQRASSSCLKSISGTCSPDIATSDFHLALVLTI
ncbi:hypothetical protein AVEN_138759-1 [Araneus ventricosus]|uniref:Uncharacterized protein n=1 Tax=Araneus ventricosus TaxID=182803 RepID=A0A4Y2FPJ3_ARAVE|nr:hypothetical protein AVEN_138759-1 [Araneus ventricosus]